MEKISIYEVMNMPMIFGKWSINNEMTTQRSHNSKGNFAVSIISYFFLVAVFVKHFSTFTGGIPKVDERACDTFW